MFMDAANSRLRPPFGAAHHVWRPVSGQMAVFPAAVAHEVALNRSDEDLVLVAARARFAALLPDALIVHTTHDPLDNCLSVYFLHLDQRMSYALDLMDTGHFYRQYRRLMAHWKRLFAADIIDFDYDRFVRAPEASARAVYCARPGVGSAVPRAAPRGGRGEDGQCLASARAAVPARLGACAALLSGSRAAACVPQRPLACG